jgi:zinc protease
MLHARFAALIVISLALLAPHRALAMDARPFAHEASDLPVRAEILWGRLDNGIRYAIWPLPQQEKASLRLLVEAGSLNEEERERGLAHFLEHMAFKASENLPPNAMIPELQRLGLGFGPHINGTTGFDRTWYKLDLPDASEALIERGLFVLREMAGRTTFPAAEIEPERGVVLSEMRLRDDQDRHQGDAVRALVFGEWLNERHAIGVPQVIESVQREDFLRFYRRWYRPERTAVIVAGAVDPRAIESLIRARFADMPASSAPEPDPVPPPLAPRGRAIRLAAKQGSSLRVGVAAAQPIVDFRDDFRRREALTKLALAEQIVRRRLNDRARGAGGVFAVKDFGTQEWFGRVRVGLLELTTTAEHWRETVAAGEQELRRVTSLGFAEDEVAEAKAGQRKSWQLLIANDAATKPPQAVDRLVGAMRADHVVNEPKPVIDRLDAAMAGWNAAELQEALRTLFPDDDRRWVLSGPLGGVTEAEVADAIAASEALAVAAPQERKEVVFAYADFGAPGAVIARDEARPGLTIATFANATRLVVLRTKTPTDNVHVGIDIIGQGRATLPPELDGVAYFAGRDLLQGGLVAHPYGEVLRWLRLHGIELNFAVAETQLRLTATASRSELGAALRIGAAYLSAPGLRPSAFNATRGALDRIDAEFEATPQAIVDRRLPRRRCAGDTRCGDTDLATLKTRRWEEIKDWLAPALREAPLVVTVVGPVDPDAVIGEVGATFGALPQRRDAPRDRMTEIELPSLPGGTVETLTYANDGQAALVLVEWPAANARDLPRWIGQGVVARLVGNRLLATLRAIGDSYTPGAATLGTINIRPAWLRARVDAKPEMASDVARRIVALGEDLAAHPFTEAELTRARAVALTAAAERLQDDRAMLNALRGEVDAATTLDQVSLTQAMLERLTLDEINALARELLDPKEARSYLILPRRVAANR